MVKASTYFILTAGILLAVFVFGFNGSPGTILFFGCGFLALLNIVSYYYVSSAIDLRPGLFIRRFMASMMIKLLISVGLLVWYMMQADRDKSVAVFLVVLYFILLMVNSTMAMGQLKQKWNEGGE